MNSSYKIIKKGKISNWDEGLPLGNGKLGCIIYGDTSLRFSLDRSDLWDRRVPPETQEEGFTYKNQIYTAKNDWAEHQRLFDNSYAHPYPTKISAGRIVFCDSMLEDAVFELDLLRAEANVTTGNGNYRSIISKNDRVGVIACPMEVEWKIETPQYLQDEENGLGYPDCKRVKDDYIYTIQNTKTEFCYGLMIKEVVCKNEKTLYYTVWSGEDCQKAIDEAKKLISTYCTMGYDAIFEEQKQYWDKYYTTSSISVGDNTFDEHYLKTKYLFASASRQGGLPMPLQGVWTADNGKLAPWKGDYHADLNMQMCYEAYMKAGLFSEGRVLCDYLWDNRVKYEEHAQKFYGVKGLLIPGVSAIDGTPLGGWPMYALNPLMAAWLIKCFDEYYVYTRDEEFFKERAYPMLAGVSEAISQLLIEEDGQLRLPLTVSPEYNDGRKDAYLNSQSNFEIAVLKWLFRTAKNYCEKVQDKEKALQYAEILSKVKDYAVDSNGALMINDELHYCFSHRHFSHLLSICPFHEFDCKNDKEFILKNIEKLEEFGTSLWIGFSFVAMAELSAYIGEGNRAYRYLRDYIEGFTADNGFHLNGDYKNYGYSSMHYRPFTLEAVFGFSKAVQEMLLSGHGNEVELFPAIPDCWKSNKISFNDLVVENGIRVSACYENGWVQNVVLSSSKDCFVKLKNAFTQKAVDVFIKANEKVQLRSCDF